MTKKEAEKIDPNLIKPGEGAKLLLENQDFRIMVIENMEMYGGSFVGKLGTLFRRADSDNRELLLGAFYHKYFVSYFPIRCKRKNAS